MIAIFLALCLALAFNAQAQTNGGYGSALPNTCTAGSIFTRTGASAGFYFCSATDTWTQVGGGGSGESVPQGAIILIDSGSCPTGYEEASELSGRTIIGTTAANGDVGQTGGSDSITSVLNHTHAVSITDPGHVHVENTNSATTGGLRGSTPDTSTNTSVASGYSTASATTGITASSANPAGGVASIDNRSAFVKVIPCRKT